MTGVTRRLNRSFAKRSNTGTNTVDVTVPADERWKILAIAQRLDTSAVAGNRILIVEFKANAAAAPSVAIETPITTTANDTAFGLIGPGVPEDSSKQNQTYTIPVTELVAEPGNVIRCRDTADIDNVGDVLALQIHVEIEAAT